MKQKANTDLVLVEINSEKKNYSLCLRDSAEKIDLIEAAAARDPGHRGIQHMIQPQTLRSAALGLSHANNILLTTGSYKGLKVEGPLSGRSRESGRSRAKLDGHVSQRRSFWMNRSV